MNTNFLNTVNVSTFGPICGHCTKVAGTKVHHETTAEIRSCYAQANPERPTDMNHPATVAFLERQAQEESYHAWRFTIKG